MDSEKVKKIKENFYSLGYVKLSEMINEDIYDIFLVVKELGLNDYLKDEELIEAVKNDFKKRMSCGDLSKKYNIPVFCVSKIIEGIFANEGRRRWSDDEIKILDEYYGKVEFCDLKEMLVPRSSYSIRKAASNRNLTSHMVKWSAEEKNFLYDNMKLIPVKEIAACLDKSEYACFAMYKKMLKFRDEN